MEPFKAKLKPFKIKFAKHYPYLDDDIEHSKMIKFFGTEVTIIEELPEDCVFIKEDGREWEWSWDWFKK